MELKHPGGTPLAENGLASADPVLALPGGLCGRGMVEDGFSEDVLFPDITVAWETRGLVEDVVNEVVLLSVSTVTWGARGLVLFLDVVVMALDVVVMDLAVVACV